MQCLCNGDHFQYEPEGGASWSIMNPLYSGGIAWHMVNKVIYCHIILCISNLACTQYFQFIKINTTWFNSVRILQMWHTYILVSGLVMMPDSAGPAKKRWWQKGMFMLVAGHKHQVVWLNKNVIYLTWLNVQMKIVYLAKNKTIPQWIRLVQCLYLQKSVNIETQRDKMFWVLLHSHCM